MSRGSAKGGVGGVGGFGNVGGGGGRDIGGSPSGSQVRVDKLPPSYVHFNNPPTLALCVAQSRISRLASRGFHDVNVLPTPSLHPPTLLAHSSHTLLTLRSHSSHTPRTHLSLPCHTRLSPLSFLSQSARGGPPLDTYVGGPYTRTNDAIRGPPRGSGKVSPASTGARTPQRERREGTGGGGGGDGDGGGGGGGTPGRRAGRAHSARVNRGGRDSTLSLPVEPPSPGYGGSQVGGARGYGDADAQPWTQPGLRGKAAGNARGAPIPPRVGTSQSTHSTLSMQSMRSSAESVRSAADSVRSSPSTGSRGPSSARRNRDRDASSSNGGGNNASSTSSTSSFGSTGVIGPSRQSSARRNRGSAAAGADKLDTTGVIGPSRQSSARRSRVNGMAGGGVGETGVIGPSRQRSAGRLRKGVSTAGTMSSTGSNGFNDGDNVRVVVRCRPANEAEQRGGHRQIVYVNTEEAEVELSMSHGVKSSGDDGQDGGEGQGANGSGGNAESVKRFTFDQCFDAGCDQQMFFEESGIQR